MRFDVIIGNPPYQLNDGGGGGGRVHAYIREVDVIKNAEEIERYKLFFPKESATTSFVPSKPIFGV